MTEEQEFKQKAFIDKEFIKNFGKATSIKQMKMEMDELANHHPLTNDCFYYCEMSKQLADKYTFLAYQALDALFRTENSLQKELTNKGQKTTFVVTDKALELTKQIEAQQSADPDQR